MKAHYNRSIKKVEESLLYVANKVDNTFKIVATLYFAEKYHLQKYGRTITDADYYRMDNNGALWLDADSSKMYHRWVHNTNSIRGANLNYLSNSDVECLDKAMDEIKTLSVSGLFTKVRAEKAYQKTKDGDKIRTEDIVKLDIVDNDLWDYINSK
jgi:hypothetical protein